MKLTQLELGWKGKFKEGHEGVLGRLRTGVGKMSGPKITSLLEEKGEHQGGKTSLRPGTVKEPVPGRTSIL